jgi:hypothetical protein
VKTLTNSGDFTGRSTASEFPTLAVPQRELQTSNQPLKKPTANHLHVKSITGTLPKPSSNYFKFFTIISALRAIYRITGNFLNAATSILKRLSVRIFKIITCFYRSKQKFEFPFSP